jgi:hypothetical protein
MRLPLVNEKINVKHFKKLTKYFFPSNFPCIRTSSKNSQKTWQQLTVLPLKIIIKIKTIHPHKFNYNWCYLSKALRHTDTSVTS